MKDLHGFPSSLAVAAALTGAATLLLSSAAVAGPLLVRNQHPLVALFGLPAPLPARLPGTGAGLAGAVFNWTSFEATDSTGNRAYTLDGETREFRVHATRALGERFALHGELAWRNLGPGSLDGFVDDWHSALSLPEGSRNLLPEDALLLEYRTAGATPLHVDSRSSGIADVPLAVGVQWLEAPGHAVAAWVSIEAPTGRAEDLTGNGAVDAALSLAGEFQPREHWTLFGQLNAAWLGRGDVLPGLQEEFAWSALGGVSWQAWRALELTVQLEANSAVFDTGLGDLDGDAVVLALGGSYVTQGGWQFDVGIVEDIEPDASPDFTFNFGVRRGF